MSDLARIGRCLDISADDIAAVIGSRERTRALLQHASSVSRPEEGGARVLIVFARMAIGSSDWLDGPLRVEVGGDDEVCVIEAFVEIGGGLRERVFPPMTMNVPFAEFRSAVEKFPHAIAPLRLVHPSAQRLVLLSPEPSSTSVAPAMAAAAAAEARSERMLTQRDLPTVGRAPAPAPTPAPANALARIKLRKQGPPPRPQVVEVAPPPEMPATDPSATAASDSSESKPHARKSKRPKSMHPKSVAPKSSSPKSAPPQRAAAKSVARTDVDVEPQPTKDPPKTDDFDKGWE